MLSQMSWIKPYEVLFITSRSITAEQQARQEGMSKYKKDDISVVKFWNKDNDDEEQMLERGVQIMTYDKIVHILRERNTPDHQTLERIKIVVLDECHTLFSDTFMDGLDILEVWIRDGLYLGEKFFVGMTATPGIVLHNQQRWGVKINRVNKKVIPGYRAKKLVATNFETIPYLITSNILLGKTIVMCPTVRECFKLQSEIPNAAVLVSQNNDAYTDEMETIRKYIVEHETLPDTFLEARRRDKSGKGVEFEKRELKVLLATSTVREGFNLREESGVRNIISCYGDSLYITQFLGRARYDIDNLVVADTYIRDDNLKKQTYLAEQRKAFKGFLYLKNNLKWFDDIAHLVEHGVYGTKRFVLSSDESRFISYINSNWLAPSDATREMLDRYKIWKDTDKTEIVSRFVDCKLIPTQPQYITFNKVMFTLQQSLGYEIESGQQRFDNERHRYKLIVSFDEERISYVKAIPPVDEAGEKIFETL